MKRTIQTEIETMVAKAIVAQNVTEGAVVEVVVNGEEDYLEIKMVKKT